MKLPVGDSSMASVTERTNTPSTNRRGVAREAAEIIHNHVPNAVRIVANSPQLFDLRHLGESGKIARRGTKDAVLLKPCFAQQRLKWPIDSEATPHSSIAIVRRCRERETLLVGQMKVLAPLVIGSYSTITSERLRGSLQAPSPKLREVRLTLSWSE